MDKSKIVIIDGNSLLFRAYYATSYGDPSSIMRTSKGVPTNAVFAFGNMMAKILSSLKKGDMVFVGFDTDSSTFRKEEFAAYKANRAPCPEELIPQFPISREILDALSIVHYEESGVEADDICGTIAKKASAEGYQVEIYTSDKDYLQLIDENVAVLLLKTGLSNLDKMTEASLMESWGLTPSQIIDYKGLRGDPSDNIPGIPGVGDKTAKDLLHKYGSFQGVKEHMEEIPGKLGEKIRNNIEKGELSYHLASIKLDVKLPFGLESLKYEGYDFQKVAKFSKTYELTQLVSRLPLALKKEEKAADWQTVDNLSLIKAKEVAIILDIDHLAYHDDVLKGMAIRADGKTYYISIDDLLIDCAARKILEDPTVKKTVYDGKGTIYALRKNGIAIKGIVDDILLLTYLLDSSSTATPHAVYAYHSIMLPKREKDGDNVALCAMMAEKIGEISEKSRAILNENGEISLYEEIELPLMRVLSDMEWEGFPLSLRELEELGNEYRKERDSLERKLIELAGETINFNSPKQVADLFFEKLKLPNPRGGSTSVEALNEIKDKHEIVKVLLEYRKYQKMISTYVEGLIPHLKEDGKIHSYFNQAVTATGRLSSSSPNLQNIATRDEESRLIKKCFHYDDGNTVLLSLDYGQIELRVLASLSNAKNYIDVFLSGQDVHEETAKRIFKTEHPTPLERRRAKAINFAIIYGTTIYGLSEQLGSTPKEAAAFIDSFYEAYPELRLFLDGILKEVEEKGYVSTLFKRRRYLPDITDRNYAKREAARRAALNAPIQGTAADLIKIAMIRIDEYLKKSSHKCKMVLQIHDELIFALPKEEVPTLLPLLKSIMETAVELKVPLVADGGYGHSWYEAKE